MTRRTSQPATGCEEEQRQGGGLSAEAADANVEGEGEVSLLLSWFELYCPPVLSLSMHVLGQRICAEGSLYQTPAPTPSVHYRC